MPEAQPEDVIRLVQRLLDEQRAGLEAKAPDLELERDTAARHGRRAGQVDVLTFMIKWLTDRLAAKSKYEDTTALEELLSVTQFELGRVQDGRDTFIEVGRGEVFAVGPNADAARAAEGAR